MFLRHVPPSLCQVITAMEALEGDALEQFKAAIESSGAAQLDGFEITADLVSFKSEKKTVVEVPHSNRI